MPRRPLHVALSILIRLALTFLVIGIQEGFRRATADYLPEKAYSWFAYVDGILLMVIWIYGWRRRPRADAQDPAG